MLFVKVRTLFSQTVTEQRNIFAISRYIHLTGSAKSLQHTQNYLSAKFLTGQISV